MTKDTLISQEVPKVLGTLYQEHGTKIKYIFLLYHNFYQLRHRTSKENEV